MMMKLKQTCIFLAATILVLLMNTAQSHAQGLPCEGGDPDVDCPIDTPVILLVLAVLFLSVKKMLDTNRQLK